MQDDIAVHLNGENRLVPASATIATLLATIGLDRRKVAIERNAAIVPRSTYEQVGLAAGDRIEIVHFIGGG